MPKQWLLAMVILLLPGNLIAQYPPVTFTDSSGRVVQITARPHRVVSLVPTVTEILMKIGAGESLLGRTHHSVLPAGLTGKQIVGGFFKPDLDQVARTDPELIFYSDLQQQVTARFEGKVQLVNLSSDSIRQSFDHIRLLGRIFKRQAAAKAIIAEQQRQLKVMEQKVAQIPEAQRKRVMRLMGRDRIMTPGDDSFQHDYITGAGGIPPRLGRDGAITAVSLEEWQQFNPQYLYGCGDDRTLLEFKNTAPFSRLPWPSVMLMKRGCCKI